MARLYLNLVYPPIVQATDTSVASVSPVFALNFYLLYSTQVVHKYIQLGLMLTVEVIVKTIWNNRGQDVHKYGGAQ